MGVGTMTELPAPTTTSANGTPVWRANGTMPVTAYPARVGMYLPEIGAEVSYTPADARTQAFMLLAAEKEVERKDKNE